MKKTADTSSSVIEYMYLDAVSKFSQLMFPVWYDSEKEGVLCIVFYGLVYGCLCMRCDVVMCVQGIGCKHFREVMLLVGELVLLSQRVPSGKVANLLSPSGPSYAPKAAIPFQTKAKNHRRKNYSNWAKSSRVYGFYLLV
jgi:hypothetical protein